MGLIWLRKPFELVIKGDFNGFTRFETQVLFDREFRFDVYVLTPHIGADNLQAFQRQLADGLEEAAENFLGWISSDVPSAKTT